MPCEQPTIALKYWPQQSPINIERKAAIAVTSTPQLSFNYPHSLTGKFDECDLQGHDCNLVFDKSSGASLAFEGQSCPLLKLHFHSPSEHRLDGRQYPLELHLVHELTCVRGGSTKVVVGVFLREDAAAPTIQALQKIGDALRAAPAAGAACPAPVTFDPWEFLPWPCPYFRYEGSLTTPPYAEEVSWVVLEVEKSASPAELAPFLKFANHSAREPQGLSRRFVLRVTP